MDHGRLADNMKITHMRRLYTLILLCVVPLISNGQQTGINSSSPQGVLDINTTNDTGFVLTRVSSLQAVTNAHTGSSTPAVGTIVYAEDIEKVCQYLETGWTCYDENGFDREFPNQPDYFPPESETYFKPFNTSVDDEFGFWVSLDESGNYLAVSARRESSPTGGINSGDQGLNDSPGSSGYRSGAVYVFFRDPGTNAATNDWSQQAYIKAPSPSEGATFGWRNDIDADGNTLVVGERNAGAGNVYVYTRSGTTWSLQQTLTASNADTDDHFGSSVSLSADGNTLVVGADFEDSSATGVNGNESNNSATNAGAAYVFTRSGSTWTQQAYLKASNTSSDSSFGFATKLSDDGTYIVVGARFEDTTANNSGAAYVFHNDGSGWTQQAFLKASNIDANDEFGYAVSLNDIGSTLMVGARYEDSNATGVNGNQADNSAADAGAVYVFTRDGTTWSQQAYLKASNSDAGDEFGRALSISDDGDTLIVSSMEEDSDGTGIGDGNNGQGVTANNASPLSGATYIFARAGNSWVQRYTIKPFEDNSGDERFGRSVDFASDSFTVAIGARREQSNATTINGNQLDNSTDDSGAVFMARANNAN